MILEHFVWTSMHKLTRHLYEERSTLSLYGTPKTLDKHWDEINSWAFFIFNTNICSENYQTVLMSKTNVKKQNQTIRNVFFCVCFLFKNLTELVMMWLGDAALLIMLITTFSSFSI